MMVPTKRFRRTQCDRRTLLFQVAGGLGASIAITAWPGLRRATAAGQADPEELKQRIRGAILSIPTPFTANLEVDYAGVRNMVTRALPHGIRIFSLTSGNSLYAQLTYEEILELTRVMVDAAGQDSITIAAADDWALPRIMEYATFAADAGATAIQVMRPKGMTDDDAARFFQEFAANSPLPIVLHGEFSPGLLEALSPTRTVFALKEDVSLDYYIKTQRLFGKRYAIFEGGPEYIFLAARPYGSPASYTTLGTFLPQLTARFWKAVEQDDMAEAYRLVVTYEHPFFDRWSHEFWHASLEHFGVAPRFMRPPFVTFTDEQMKDVARFYKDLGLS